MGPSFLVITLTPPLSREPGEGVTWSRPAKGLFGAEDTEHTEVLNIKEQGAERECLGEILFGFWIFLQTLALKNGPDRKDD
jgi:hypothetical protein